MHYKNFLNLLDVTLSNNKYKSNITMDYTDDLNLTFNDNDLVVILVEEEQDYKPYPLLYTRYTLNIMLSDRAKINDENNNSNPFEVIEIVNKLLHEVNIIFVRNKTEHDSENRIWTIKYDFWLPDCWE